MWIEAKTGIVTNCNKATEAITGRVRKSIVGQHHTVLYPPDKGEHYHRLLCESDAAPSSTIEAEITRAGGEVRMVTIAVSTMVVEEKQIVQGIIRDVTDSRSAIEEIKSLAKFPSEDPNPVLRISRDSRILYANDASTAILDTWKVEEGGRLSEPWCTRVEESYHSGNSTTCEFDSHDGRVYFMTLQPVTGSGYVNAYGLDITKRKKAEKETIALELQLGQKQKMEAIGTLAGGIAHDFNNILGAMQGYVELSLDDLSDDGAVESNLQQMMSCIHRATKLVKQILGFSRKDQREQEKEPVQISLIAREVLEMLRASLPATIKICRKIHAESSTVLADSTQIHQVLVNLCTNAAHAMREKGGLLEVSLTDADLESETVVGDEHLRNGSYVKLSVSDSGSGMDEETVKRIFEPFFTTKQADEGTGLGLSVVHGIIKSHDGAISVSSVPGKGTTFDIFLPKAAGGDVEERRLLQTGTQEKELVLLVDDEEMMVDVTQQTLRRLGFDVIAKTSSIDALEAFQEEPERFDLVITGQVMPNMLGTELAQNLISIRPDIPVILCSGFPEKVSPEELNSIGIKEFVTKPVSMQRISEIVQKVLHEHKVTT